MAHICQSTLTTRQTQVGQRVNRGKWRMQKVVSSKIPGESSSKTNTKWVIAQCTLSGHLISISGRKTLPPNKSKDIRLFNILLLSVSSTPQWRRMLHNSPNFANKQLSDQSGNVQGLISTRSSRGREREKFQSGKKQALVHNLWSFCCYDNPIMENNYLDWLRLSKKTTNHGIAIVDVFFKSPLVSTSKFKSSPSRFTI